jgi:signal transduction histidine kinase
MGAAQQVGWRPSLIAGYGLFAVYSIALTELFRREIVRRKWLDASTGRMAALLAVGAAIVGSVQTFLVVAVDFTLQGSSNWFVRRPGYAIGLWMGVIGITCVWTILYVSLTAHRRSREKAVHLELAVRKAELRALEAQINPHFLFNCLNSIRGLVVEDPALAQDMVTRLSNILRYNLHRPREHTVPLSSELEAVSDYLALESVRLEERLRVRMEIQPEASAFPVPAMMLQTLVENAVKYGIAAQPDGGELRVSARLNGEGLALEVDNPGKLGDKQPGDGGLGLANARERLRLLYGNGASLQLEQIGGRVAATVHLPRIL